MKLKFLIEKEQYIADDVYYEDDKNKIYIINIKTKQQDTFNKKFYTVWWEGIWSGRKQLIIYNRKNDRVATYANVNTKLGNLPADKPTSDPKIDSMKKARK